MRFIIFWIFTGLSSICLGQGLSLRDDILYAYEVKQIDEFLERFNNEETAIKKYIRQTEPNAIISRLDMIKSLINRNDSTWNLTLINEFIGHINDQKNPVFLNFVDPEWYAQVDCSVRYLHKDHKVSLILKIEKGLDESLKWVITMASGEFLRLPKDSNTLAFLNPVSQGTDFLGLDKALHDKKYIKNYLPAGYKENQLSIFLNHWKDGTIQLNQVNKITYHFLQIDGYIFKVENFNRKSRNHGWLISSLCKANTIQKAEYKSEILHMN